MDGQGGVVDFTLLGTPDGTGVVDGQGGVVDAIALSQPRIISLTSNISNAGHYNLEKYTNLLCRDIKNSFHHLHNCHIAPTREPAVDSDAKKELIRITKGWVERIVKSDAPFCVRQYDKVGNGTCSQRQAVMDALALLIRTLDDVDVENLQYLQSRRNSNRKPRKRLIEQKKIQQSVGFTHQKQRSRLPPKIRSTDVVRAMHDEGIVEQELHLPTFHLSNSDLSYKRAKRSYLQSRHGSSMMGISMKAVMNAHVPITVADELDIDASEGVITTLPTDASDLRKHLYKHLAAFDAAVIDRRKCVSAHCEMDKGGSTISAKLQLKIKTMTSALLGRIMACPTSPSMRLSAVVALDSLHELGLRDWAYNCLLDELLDMNAQLPIQFHAEILSECHAYEDPLRLLRALNKLMRKALEANSFDDGTPTLLRRGMSKILVRRQNILTTFNQDSMRSCPMLKKDLDTYNRLCDIMSVRFGSVSNWILPTMKVNDKEVVISALQAGGILSLFCCEDIDDEVSRPSSQSTQTFAEYPIGSSLRSAHDRMLPFDVFKRLLSHPKSYDQTIQKPESSLTSTEVVVGSPISSANDDMLVAIFSFLGYRSLARASTCCVSWKRASKAPTLWSTLYFRKYRNAILEEELLDLGGVNVREFLPSSVAERQRFATSGRDYDWKHIFSTKYAVDKLCKAKSCKIVGCLHVSRRSAQTHMKR